MGPAQPGSQARGLRMRLFGEEDLSFALLLLARSKPGDQSSVWDTYPLPSVTQEAFICLTRRIKMLVVLD